MTMRLVSSILMLIFIFLSYFGIILPFVISSKAPILAIIVIFLLSSYFCFWFAQYFIWKILIDLKCHKNDEFIKNRMKNAN